MNILETNRLVLRRLALPDAADLYRVYSSPETMKFMGKAPDSVEEERDHIQAHIDNHYEKYGVGLWMKYERDVLYGDMGKVALYALEV